MSRRLVVAELAAAGIAGVIVVFTIAWPAWIELVVGVDPDHHSGLFEILIVGLLTAVGAATSLAVRAQQQRAGQVGESGAATTKGVT